MSGILARFITLWLPDMNFPLRQTQTGAELWSSIALIAEPWLRWSICRLGIPSHMTLNRTSTVLKKRARRKGGMFNASKY